jgi:hypothetical protein
MQAVLVVAVVYGLHFSLETFGQHRVDVPCITGRMSDGVGQSRSWSSIMSHASSRRQWYDMESTESLRIG